MLPYATAWKDLKSIMLSEISQTEKDLLYGITYMWNLKIQQTSEYLGKRSRLTDTEN